MGLGKRGGFDATAARLLRNQTAIGDVVKPYYGRAAGNNLTALLRDHIGIAVELLQDMPALTTHVASRLRAGRAAVASGLGALGGVAMPPTRGGLSTWLDLGAPVSTEVSLAARRHGLIVPPGPRFTTGGVLERRLRIPITLPPERTAEAMERLGRAWSHVMSGGATSDEEAPRAAII